MGYEQVSAGFLKSTNIFYSAIYFSLYFKPHRKVVLHLTVLVMMCMDLPKGTSKEDPESGRCQGQRRGRS